MSGHIPSITEADVRILATPQSFERGFGYFQSGAILEPVRQGDQLRAYCHGSSYEPYRVSATLGAGESLVTAYCTCPYNWGGICKHLVALLLTWIHEPEVFHTLPPLDSTLASRSKEELIALIKEMFQREPDLIGLLELPVLPEPGAPLDLEVYRRQINRLWRGVYPDLDDLAVELSAIVGAANRFLEAGDWFNAGALYCLVLTEVVPFYADLYDEHGQVNLQLCRCAEGLDNCFFEGSPDADVRRTWLESLLEAELKDVGMGGIDFAYPAGELVIGHATDEEWTWIEKRVRQVIADSKDPYSSWGRERLVGFLTQRLELKDREAEIDDLIFELGSPEQRAFRLVQLGRFEEAVDLAQGHFATSLGLIGRFADALVEAGAGPIAEALITSMLHAREKAFRTAFYLGWLAEYAERRGDLTAALDRWQQLYRASPDIERYQKLRDVASQVGRWEDLHSELLQELEANQRWNILVQIALDEDDVARALELLPRQKGRYGPRYDLQVAKAAEKDYPQAALDIYSGSIQGLIDARGRGNYQEAAGLLIRVRHLYARQNDLASWDLYIADLRQRYRRLPALRDELDKAGL